MPDCFNKQQKTNNILRKKLLTKQAELKKFGLKGSNSTLADNKGT